MNIFHIKNTAMLGISLCFLATCENAYSMMEIDNWEKNKEKNIFRKGFIPKSKVSEDKITYNTNIPKEELKIDNERKMPYYGKSLSELPPINKSPIPIREDERKVVFSLKQVDSE